MIKRILPSVLICSSMILGISGTNASAVPDAANGAPVPGPNNIILVEPVQYPDDFEYDPDAKVFRISADDLIRLYSFFDGRTHNFYDVLTDNEKIAYDMIKAALNDDLAVEIIEMDGVTDINAALRAYCAFVADSPEYFWLTGLGYGFSYGDDGNITKITIVLKCCAGQSFDKIEDNYKKFTDKVDEIVKEAGKYTNDYDKMKYFAGYIADNMTYDHDAAAYGHVNDAEYENRWNAYGALISGSGVCEAYAEAFKVLCDSAGIPCISVYSSDHEWNAVKLGSSWYYVDVTWIDTEDPSTYRFDEWFAVGTVSAKANDNPQRSHTPQGKIILSAIDSDFTYPDISSTDYEPGVIIGDLNGDGIINNKDLVLLRYYYYSAPLPSELRTAADIDENGVFDEEDITALRKWLVS